MRIFAHETVNKSLVNWEVLNSNKYFTHSLPKTIGQNNDLKERLPSWLQTSVAVSV